MLDSTGVTVPIEKPLTPGRTSAALSRPVTLAVEDLAALSQLHTDLTAAIPAGTNVIGHVIVDSMPASPVTNTGTFAVQNTAATPAGTNVIGHVIVDGAPSTPVTNAGTFSVQNTAATPTGNNVIGHVIVDSMPASPVTNGGTFAVQNTAATPAGTNVIGHVIVDTAPSTPVTNAGTFAVQAAATLAAETTKVIGTVNVAAAQNITPVDQYATHKEVGASATAAVLGATGAVGDYLSHVTVFPGVAACGVVTILDGASVVGTFAGGGTTPLSSLVPFIIPIGAFCTGAGWHITTGASVTVTAVGKFT